jgi:hypothetical protein
VPSLTPGATALLDVTVNGARAGDLAQASLASSTQFIEIDAAVWSNNTVRVIARNISAATSDPAAATLSLGGGEAADARVARCNPPPAVARRLAPGSVPASRTTQHLTDPDLPALSRSVAAIAAATRSLD